MVYIQIFPKIVNIALNNYFQSITILIFFTNIVKLIAKIVFLPLVERRFNFKPEPIIFCIT
jgi:hypothetical protein